MKITGEQIGAYREQGFFFIEDLIPRKEIEFVRNELPGATS